MADVLNALQYHNHHDGGAVWIGNDSLWTNERILGIALGYYEGYVGVHAECRTVVNHHGTVLRDVGCKLLRCATTCRSEGDIYALEVLGVVLELLDNDILATEVISTTC